MFSKNDKLLLKTYTDRDYAELVIDKRYTTSYCIFLKGNLIICRNKKQNVLVALGAKSKFRNII